MNTSHSQSLTAQAPQVGARASGVSEFNVYGFRFCVRGSAPEAMDGIREDFAFFSAPGTAATNDVELLDENPPYDLLPPVDASVYTPRNVVYRHGGKRYVDYHGRALGIQDEQAGNMKFYSRDQNLLYEATYLYLIARIGEYLDQQGLHRMHAVGVSINGRAVLVMLPMGGGKSTLGMHLLKHPNVRVLSDDSPIISRTGRVLAYPLRFGLLPGMESSVPPQHRRMIQRMEFGPKHLVNYSYFQDRVAASSEPGLVMIGVRTFAPGCAIEKISISAGLRACIPHCVVGLGLFHGLEFLLQASGWEIVKKTGVGMSRLRNCWQLLRRSSVCRIHLGPDPDVNAQTLIAYANSLSA